MARRTRPARIAPLAYDDAVRGGIPLGAGVLGFAAVIVLQSLSGVSNRVFIAAAGCAALILALGAYLLWTHILFARTDPARLARLAAAQFRRGPSPVARLLGMSSPESWAISVAVAALAGAVAAVVLGTHDGGVLLAGLALLTAVAAWATVVYAFALRYLRLHAAGERFRFDIDEEPEFSDFVTTALMISSAGALSAAVPTTRPALRAVRAHTVIAFAFNALVIAMTVSLISSLVFAVGAPSG